MPDLNLFCEHLVEDVCMFVCLHTTSTPSDNVVSPPHAWSQFILWGFSSRCLSAYTPHPSSYLGMPCNQVLHWCLISILSVFQTIPLFVRLTLSVIRRHFPYHVITAECRLLPVSPCQNNLSDIETTHIYCLLLWKGSMTKYISHRRNGVSDSVMYTEW